LVRKPDAAIDFLSMYSPDHGRSSIVYLIRHVLLVRETVEQIRTNVAYRWFLGLSLSCSRPHHSTPGKNDAYRFAGTDGLQAFPHGLADSSVVYVDSTHVKASANMERDFADIKEKYGLRWAHYRVLKKARGR
jgi:hypothetical protein